MSQESGNMNQDQATKMPSPEEINALRQRMAAVHGIQHSGYVTYPTQFDAIRQFCVSAEGKGVCYLGDFKHNVPVEVIKARITIIEEEVNNELLPLLRQIAENGGSASLEQKAALLDHIVDSVYVILGTAINFCLPFDTGFGIVHNANMRKTMRIGGPIFREDGKVMKPEGWISPDAGIFELILAVHKEVMKQPDSGMGARKLEETAGDASFMEQPSNANQQQQ